MKKLLLSLVLALVMTFGVALPAYSAAAQEVAVTATPAFIGIANAPSTWAVNDVAGATGKSIAPDTVYYSNPLGDTTIPSDPVVDGECRFTITNSSSVITDLTVNFPSHAGGDASTNSDLGSNAATSFGAYSYCTGMTYSTGKVIAKTTGSAVMKASLVALTNIKWGLTYESQSNAWTSGTNMTSTVTITATASA